jgi:hypothetical protein
MWFRKIDDPVINPSDILVKHLLLLPVDLTGDQQHAIKLCSKARKPCAAIDHAVNRLQVSPDLVELKALSFLDLFPPGLFRFDDH